MTAVQFCISVRPSGHLKCHWNRRRASELTRFALGTALSTLKRIHFSGHAQFVGRKCCSTPSILVGVLATTLAIVVLCLQTCSSSCYHFHIESRAKNVHTTKSTALNKLPHNLVQKQLFNSTSMAMISCSSQRSGFATKFHQSEFIQHGKIK